MVKANGSNRNASLSFSEQNERRGGLSTVLLGTGAAWLLGIAYFLYRSLPERHVIPLFLFVAIVLSIAACASTQTGEWDRFGQLALWGVFGSTLSIWMIGIFSIGWLFFPVLLLEVLALIAWPRPEGTSIVSKAGIAYEIVGFLSTPAVLVTGIHLTGGF